MKLLIVDDEELTRKGLLNTIDRAALNITEIYDADDGINGIKLAREHKPDIILSDIRMPRMNGIEMIQQIRTFLPDVSIIFMSGYSDREYLKSAIKLKAISYVEKPIVSLEIEDAIFSAVENNEKLKRSRQSEAVHSLAKAGRLALSMTYPPEQQKNFLKEDLKQTDISVHFSMNFTAFIIKSTRSFSDISEERLQQIHLDFHDFLQNYQLEEIHIIKHDQYLVYHIFGDQRPEERLILRIGEFLRRIFADTVPFFIAAGETVHGLQNAYRSYNTAVVLLQSCFFYEYSSFLIPQKDDTSYKPAVTDSATVYMEALLSKNSERIEQIELQMYNSFRNCSTMLPNKVKDIYYKLFMTIQNSCRSLSLNAANVFVFSGILLEYVENCHTLTELHQLLTDSSRSFLKLAQEQAPETSSILAIKDYIFHNYHREGLSVKEISEHIHMSSSYVCTLFKNETGLTLNQYITNYRMEKAKLLLSDSSFKITDISLKIGYADGNYFAKSFRKQVGLSPSEYREKIV